MKKDYTVVLVTPEMMIPELGEPACGANFRGGLGRLIGDIKEGAARKRMRIIVVSPLYTNHWVSKELIDYEKTFARSFLDLVVPAVGKRISVRLISDGTVSYYGLMHKDFDILYVADRGKRLEQEVLLGHAVPALFKKLRLKPDIVWLQEGHTSVIIPVMKDDPFFDGVKFVFNIHTPAPEGLEKFYGDRFFELKIHDKYRSVFIKDGTIDMVRGGMSLSDIVIAVSEEHGEKTKEMFPEFAHKTISITNGVDGEFWLSPHVKAWQGFDSCGLGVAHEKDKSAFIRLIYEKSGATFDSMKPILAYTGRLAWYKNQFPMLAPIADAVFADRGEMVDTPLGKVPGLGFHGFAAGRAHESDNICLGWMSEFHNWMTGKLKGKFVFVPEYNVELLQKSCWGCDIWFSRPMPRWEACGTSEMIAFLNGIPVLTSYGGGARENVKEFDSVTGEGNGFFIVPYDITAVYFQLKMISNLYYGWVLNREAWFHPWRCLKMNAFETGRRLDVGLMLEKYQAIFEALIQGR